jgi:hypothetical protein
MSRLNRVEQRKHTLRDQARETLRGQNRRGRSRVRRDWRIRFLLLLALLWAGLGCGSASAGFLYEWFNTSGPIVKAWFLASDAVVASGLIQASAISPAPGFRAQTPAGNFTSLTPDSAMSVDPVSGAVLASSHSLTATNATDTLLMSSSGYFIPTSQLQTRGKGRWNVMHIADNPPAPSLSFLGFTNGQPQLVVSYAANGTFVLESSADLRQWQPIATNQLVGGVSLVTDPNPATTPSRFYRAVFGR